MAIDNFTDNLLVRLINHRVTDEYARKEDYLTECFAWILENDYDIRTWFLKKAGALFKDNKDNIVPLKDLKIETQKSLSRNDRPDITIQSKNILLIVECKVDAPIDEGQLKRYLDYAKKKKNSNVLALVPADKISSQSNRQLGSNFLGFFSWEEIAEKIPSLSSAGEGLDLFRKLFLRLLDSYGLVPISGQLNWMKTDGRQNIEKVEKICNGLNRIIAQVQENKEIANSAPRLYRNNRLLKLTSGIQRSGKGPSPRPVLRHYADLCSNFHPFLNFRINTYFQHPSSLQNFAEPFMGIEVWTLEWNRFIGEVKGVETIIKKIGKGKQSFPTNMIHNNLLQKVKEVMYEFLIHIKNSGILVKTNLKVQSKPAYIHHLLLIPTQSLFQINIESDKAFREYEKWLCQVIKSWFKANPERILNDLFMDLMLDEDHPII